MPLPWKKTKVARISRFVADLQSPRRGGSLVVETGFPTSLVDLFVKNRDRLKKPSKRRPKLPTQIAGPVNSQNQVVNPSKPVLYRETKEVVAEEEIESSRIDDTINDHKIVQETVGDVGSDLDSDSTRVFYAVLRVFVVVILALSTTKLAVGITLSAFVLLFLEYVGDRVIFFLKPCSIARIQLDSLIRKVLYLLRFEKKGTESRGDSTRALILKEETVVVSESKSSVQEIQVVDSNRQIVAGIEDVSRSTEPNLDFLSRDKRWGCLDAEIVEEKEDRSETLMLKSNQHSKSGKIKAKIINKFVPKKLRSSKKRKKVKKNELDSSEEENVKNSGDQEEEPENGECQIHNSENRLPTSPLDDEEEDGNDNDDQNCREQKKSDYGISSSGVLAIEESVGRERKGHSGYLIMFLVVLGGLVGGKILALVLTVGWCFMVGRLERYLCHVPIRRSPVTVLS